MPVTIGRVTTEITELTAVRVMLSATSPRKRWLKRLAVVPPGDAASSIIPIPSRAGQVGEHHEPEADQRQQHQLAAERDGDRLGPLGDAAEVRRR